MHQPTAAEMWRVIVNQKFVFWLPLRLRYRPYLPKARNAFQHSVAPPPSRSGHFLHVDCSVSFSSIKVRCPSTTTSFSQFCHRRCWWYPDQSVLLSDIFYIGNGFRFETDEGKFTRLYVPVALLVRLNLPCSSAIAPSTRLLEQDYKGNVGDSTMCCVVESFTIRRCALCGQRGCPPAAFEPDFWAMAMALTRLIRRKGYYFFHYS